MWEKVWVYLAVVFLVVGGIATAEWSGTLEVEAVYQLVGQDATGRRIVWLSPVYQEAMHLEYRLLGGQSAIIRPTITTYEIEGKQGFRYQADRKGLHQEACYEYRVVAGDTATEWYRLSTEAKQYRAVVFTDSQCTGTYQAWQDTVQVARKNAREVALCLHLGDLVDCGASEYQWRRWLEGAVSIIAQGAFAPVMGNHEDYDCTWQMCVPKWYQALFSVRSNSEKELNGYVYSFDYGEVHYVLLDTQEEELRRWKSDWTARQAVWLARDLAATQAKWKVVVCHKPFFDLNGVMTEHGKTWLPICQAYGVDLILSGHHHIYARRKVGDITLITAGVSGDDTGYEVDTTVLYEKVRRCDMANYLTLDVAEDGLTIQAVSVDGTILDEAEIGKR